MQRLFLAPVVVVVAAMVDVEGRTAVFRSHDDHPCPPYLFHKVDGECVPVPEYEGVLSLLLFLLLLLLICWISLSLSLCVHARARARACVCVCVRVCERESMCVYVHTCMRVGGRGVTSFSSNL